jgi:hypothetical protein
MVKAVSSKISAAKLEKPYGMTRFSRDLKISLSW